MNEPEQLTVEQMCRNLLTQAIKDRLIGERASYAIDPQNRTSGELTGMANLLNEYLGRKS